jgi:DNA-binding MarR family transcriptional regulator
LLVNWFRFYHEALEDPKVQRLEPVVFKAWVNILCLASKSRERGVLPGLEDIAFALRMDEDEAKRIVAELVARGLLDKRNDRLVIHGWSDRQPRSDNVTERVREHRSRVKQGETFQERSGNAIEKKRKDTDTEGEKKETANARAPVREVPCDASGADAPPPSESAPFALLEALCEESGVDVSVVSGDQRKKQLAVAKRLISNGVSPPDVQRIYRWLTAQSWVTGGVDLFLVEKQLGKWQLAGKPERPTDRASPANVSRMDRARASHDRLRADVAAAKARGEL